MKYAEYIQGLKELELDGLTSHEAIELRVELQQALELLDQWFANLAEVFDRAWKARNALSAGRPPESHSPPGEPPVKPPSESPRRRGRPVPKIKVRLNRKESRPDAHKPIEVGGADSAQDAPRPAQIFEDSYISNEGPRPGAQLPADHPRRLTHRESSVTPEVDLSDFHEVEAAVQKGRLDKLFQ